MKHGTHSASVSSPPLSRLWSKCSKALLVAVIAAAPATTTLVRADDVTGGNNPRPYTVHWMVTTDDLDLRWGAGIDWSARVDFGGVNIRRDMLVLYEHWFASDVKAQGFGLTLSDPGYYTRYEQTLRTMLDRRVPQGFDGYVCLDIEFAPKYWGRRTGGPEIYPVFNFGRKYYDEWYDFVRMHRPEWIANQGSEEMEHTLARTYEEAVQHWFSFTVARCRQFRPGTKWGFYGLPFGARHDQYNRPDPNPWRQRNDSLSWIVDISDCIFMALYQNRFTIPAGQTPSDWSEMTIAQSRDWIISNVREGRRISQGKPVFVLAMPRYVSSARNHGLDYLDNLAADSMFLVPKEAGADGLAIWDHILNETNYNEFQSYMNSHVLPRVAQTIGQTYPPDPGDGSGGGGGSGGGDPGDGSGGGGGSGGGDPGDGSGGGGGFRRRRPRRRFRRRWWSGGGDPDDLPGGGGGSGGGDPGDLPGGGGGSGGGDPDDLPGGGGGSGGGDPGDLPAAVVVPAAAAKTSLVAALVAMVVPAAAGG